LVVVALALELWRGRIRAMGGRQQPHAAACGGAGSLALLLLLIATVTTVALVAVAGADQVRGIATPTPELTTSAASAPPPTALPGAGLASTPTPIVECMFVVDATVDTFDSSAFATALAALFADVSRDDVSLNVTSASVRVHARITMPNATEAAAAIRTITTSTPPQLSSALGVVVHNVSAVVSEEAAAVTTPITTPITSGCAAFPAAFLGDGWCDAHEPFNTLACGWDGGDCCDPASPILDCRDPAHPSYGQSSAKGSYPAPANPRYGVFAGRSESTKTVAQSYCNAYEFTYSKTQVKAVAEQYAAYFGPPWAVAITGDVDAPLTIDVADLIRRFHLEQRTYAHRCVEAWSIIVPWVGFPLTKLLDLVRPHSSVKYVTFTSFNNRVHARFPSGFNWPYTEAITIEEARNELAFLSVGMYQAPLPAQNGAPLRLTLPWKYGFKSIKFIVSIGFVSDDGKPGTFWSLAGPAEYGFWANVNPEVDHRRWSQARERQIIDSPYGDGTIDTQLYNGYDEQVSYLYTDLLAQGERLFY